MSLAKLTQPHRALVRDVLVILACTLVAYIPSLGNGFTNWDDPTYVTRNPLLTASLRSMLVSPLYGNYSPLTTLSLALDHSLWGLAPFGYHAVNLLLHLFNTLLVFTLVHTLTKGRRWTTIVTAFFFGVHPMHVESVAWIAERKDVLCAFFYLAGLITYVAYLRQRASRWLACTFALFIFAIMSKPAAIIFPLALFAVDYVEHRPSSRRQLLEKLPFGIIAFAMALLTLHAQTTIGALERNAHHGLMERLTFAGYALATYAQRLVFPIGISALYPAPAPIEAIAALGLAAAAMLLFVVTHSRLPRHVVFGVLFFGINLLLVLQVVSVGASIVADRFTYLPYVGAFLAASWFLDDVSMAAGQRQLRAALAAVLLVLAPACVAMTWSQCGVWRDSETLWSNVIRTHPHRIALAYNNRAADRQARGRLRDALADFEEALDISPGHARTWVSRADVLFDLTRAREAEACYDSALACTDVALVATERAYILDKRGSARLQLTRYAEACDDFSRALDAMPNEPNALAGRGTALEYLGEHEKAIADWHQAIRATPRAPSSAPFLNAIGLAYQKLKRVDEAAKSFELAIKAANDTTRSTEYRRNLAKLRLAQQRETADPLAAD